MIITQSYQNIQGKLRQCPEACSAHDGDVLPLFKFHRLQGSMWWTNNRDPFSHSKMTTEAKRHHEAWLRSSERLRISILISEKHNMSSILT